MKQGRCSCNEWETTLVKVGKQGGRKLTIEPKVKEVWRGGQEPDAGALCVLD